MLITKFAFPKYLLLQTGPFNFTVTYLMIRTLVELYAYRHIQFIEHMYIDMSSFFMYILSQFNFTLEYINTVKCLVNIFGESIYMYDKWPIKITE